MLLFLKQSKLAKRLAASLATLALVFSISLLQSNVLKVKADVQVLVVSDTALPFGMVFPGQNLTRTYVVQLDTSAATASYTTVLDPIAGNGNLCPSLHITNIDKPDEPDSLGIARLTQGTDLADTWQILLDGPALIGQVADDHNGGIVVSGGGFACRITIATVDSTVDVAGCTVNCGELTDGGGVFSNQSLNSDLETTSGLGSGGGGLPSGSTSTTEGLVLGDSTGTSLNMPLNLGLGGANPGEVLGATELPRTGVPVLLYLIIGLSGALIAGFLIYQRT
jgi:hypothetical protein